MSCLRNQFNTQADCVNLLRSFNQCKATEMESIKKDFEETGMQDNVAPVIKTDKLRDFYQGSGSEKYE